VYAHASDVLVTCTMDIIYLHDLRIETTIGVYRWERQLKQTLIFDLELGTDTRPAGRSDDIADTLNYKEVSKRMIAFVQASQYQLVEALADGIAKLLTEEFGLKWFRLRINKKGALRGVRNVGIVIERGTRE
jgi:7,8-dihydroneopterin aldolase/epimerase/oxygenase